jgi:L-alanine-DL-glutamate epimerase-like enolase superfamily enzyme
VSRHPVTALDARAYRLATDQPEADGTLEWSSTTAVVVRVRSGGATGTGWTYGPAAIADVARHLLRPVVEGADPMAVARTWQAMAQVLRNATRPGLAGYALSAVDVALWDLKARLLDVPLCSLFGPAGDDVPVYGSGGFTTYSHDTLRRQLAYWAVEQRIPRVKIKIGEDWGRSIRRDLERLEIARETIGPDVDLYADANGAYRPKQAVLMMREAGAANVAWLEEPVSSDDLAGLRFVRERVDADVTAGEYGSDLTYFQRMCSADAVDCLQIDASRCGGYTEWLRAAAVAAGHQLAVSAHCAPNLHAHVALATANVRHIEWFHDHVRMERVLFDGTLDPQGGALTPDRSRSGHGLRLSDRADEYLIREGGAADEREIQADT